MSASRLDEQRARLLALTADVGRALTTCDTLADMLQGCAEALVEHLDAAFARVWTLSAAGDVLELRASAGLYTHLDGPHGRVPVGQLKIGLIAQERQPHLTNAVVGDPRVSDQEWAVREGMVAFAGYPLVVEERLVGVVALFARHPLPEATIQVIGAVADQIAVGIERLHADAERRASHARLVDVLESLGDGFYAIDAGFRFTYVNGKAESLWGRSRAELLGKRLQDEFPQMQGSESLAQQERAMRERIPCHYETASPVLGRWIEVSAYPGGDGLSVYFRDISGRRKAEDALRQFQFLVESANDALYLLDEAGRFLYVNAAACRSLGYTAEELRQMRAFDIDPIHDEAVYRNLFRRLDGGRLPPFEALHRRKDGTTFPIEASVSRLGIGGQPLLFSSCRDISERKAAERALQEAHGRTAAILESITDAFFALDGAWHFTYLNAQAERLLGRARADLLGRNVWAEFPAAAGTAFERQYRRAVAEQTAVTFEEYYPPPLDAWFEVRAYPSEDGLSVFFQDVSERKRAEAERERRLAEQRARAEREALLNRIGQAIRRASDPDAVQGAAIHLLGEALGADRCYFALYDLGNGVVTIASDWRRAGLPPVQGVYPFPNTVEMFHELYHGSNTSVVVDAYTTPLSAQTRANMERLQLRSRVSVALTDGDGLMATLTAAMADGPRAWTGEEVALVEAVGTQLRTAIEMARIQQRERNIAAQLQTALQPDLPGTVPGLGVDKHYKAALAEAGVGGDFYDVYALEKGCTALVVGDLSGKGLAAAAQVSVVRNMLRAFLYSSPKVADAVTELNRVLTENNLLTGFTTLFVGAYDSATRVLNYVSCGQEPALVRRARTGTVERLEPTGPILGAIEGARYAEASAALSPGDAVAIFTDGLTEVGPRSEMLGVEGVAALLGQCVLPEDADSHEAVAKYLSQHLVVGVNGFAQGSVRDDQCLLVGVVSGLWPS